MTAALSPLKALEESMRTSAECTDSPVAHGVLVRYADKLSAVRETVEQEMATLRRLEDYFGRAMGGMLSSDPCPLCSWATGMLVKPCGIHEYIAMQDAKAELDAESIASLRAQLAARDAEIAQLSAGKEVMREASLAECAAKVTAEAEVERLKAVVSGVADEVNRLADVSASAVAQFTIIKSPDDAARWREREAAERHIGELIRAALAPSTPERTGDEQ